MTPKSVCKVHDPRDDVHHRSRRAENQGDRDPSSEMLMPRGLPAARRQAVVHAPPIATGFAVAGIPLDRAVRQC
jgi:hypothetical protein